MIEVVVALSVKYLISMIYEISRSDYHLNDWIEKTFHAVHGVEWKYVTCQTINQLEYLTTKYRYMYIYSQFKWYVRCL